MHAFILMPACVGAPHALRPGIAQVSEQFVRVSYPIAQGHEASEEGEHKDGWGYEYLQLLACQRAGRTNAFSATCSACWLMGQSTFWALPPIPRGARSTSCFPPNRRGGEVPQPRACRRHVAGSDKSAGTSGEEARRHCQRAPGAAHTSLDRARGALDIGAMVRRLGRHRAKARTGPARRGRHAERARK